MRSTVIVHEPFNVIIGAVVSTILIVLPVLLK